MGLETTDFIEGLDESWPTDLDQVNQGDDHIRLVKSVLKDQFPGEGGSGFAKAITATEDELNFLAGVDANVQDQINENAADIDTNELAIAANAADIADNAAAIASLIPPKVTFLTDSNPTWVPTVGVRAIKFVLTGPGGGGGGVDGQGSSTGASSSGGSAGATCIKSTTIIDASYNITLPPGGLGGAAGNNNGIDAADSTLVSTTLNLVAGGGSGGAGIAGGTGQTRGPTVGGTATGGDINLPGGDGDGSTVVNSRPAGLSTSGSSYWSQGRGSREQSTGRDGIYGAGGGAVFSVNEAANYAGGIGGAAVCQITEYF